MEICFYKHKCQLGDYVYADGTFSDRNNKNKTVVGVCFYINPNDSTERLCVMTQDLTAYSWGLYENNLPGITLADHLGYNAYDVPTLANQQTTGVSQNYINSNTFRDNSSSGDADGFKILGQDTVCGEIGFVSVTNPLGGYETGAKIPYGLLNTLKIIEHRNIILNDSSINLPLPSISPGISMLQSLYNLMGRIVEQNGGNPFYNQYYYPAISQCNCYEPGVKAGEELAACFKQGKWFVPSGGELSRLFWYHFCGYELGNEGAIFAKAVSEERMTPFLNTTYYCSAEFSGAFTWNINLSNGYVNISAKANGCITRAVCVF